MTRITNPEPASFVDLLSARAALHPERLALRFLHGDDAEPTLLTYGELHAGAARLAAVLGAYATPGERALLLYPSGPEYVLALLGCFYAGIIAVPAYAPQLPQARDLARIVAIARDARPALLLTARAQAAPLAAVQAANDDLRSVQLLATDDLATQNHGMRVRLAEANALAMLQYTSGSTATPKGVMLTHANLMANQAAIHDAFSMHPDDVSISWLPLFHDMGLIGTLLQPLYAGVTAVLMPTQRFMERPRRWLEAMSRYGGTISGAPDFAYRLCTQRVNPSEGDALDLSSWRLAFCGAEPVREQTLRAFADKFAVAGFDRRALYPCYGLAEATLIVTGGRRGDGLRSGSISSNELRKNRAVPAPGDLTLVSCGVARAGHRVVVADLEHLSELPDNVVGEIQVAGPSIAQGYWDNPDATDRTFAIREGTIYLRTGDLGFLRGGELFVTGRLKDLIIVRGQNLYPQDIERAIEAETTALRSGRVVAFALDHAGVEGIAIVAEIAPRARKLSDPMSLCREIAVLVARTVGEPPTLVLLLAPRGVPVTSSGKLQRAACKRGWLDRQLPVLAAYGRAAEGTTAPVDTAPSHEPAGRPLP